MTSRELFKRFTSLCQKWPKDETKIGRDYGNVFRQELSQHFPQGELSQINHPDKVEAALSALERLANNNYYTNDMLKRSSASGMEAWACKAAISNEGIKLFEENDESILIMRLKRALSMKFSSIDLKRADLLSDDSKSSQKTHKKID